jgi:hypothetical protein
MPNTKSFAPKEYEVKTGGSDFFKPQQGDNKFRILTDMISGIEGWKDNKPFRRPEGSTIDADEVDVDQKSGKPKINEFMAMYVYNYATKKIEIASFTQATIKKEILKYSRDEEWGHPDQYDITVSKSGEGLTTKYSFKFSPAKPLAKDVQTVVDAASPEFDLVKALSIES